MTNSPRQLSKTVNHARVYALGTVLRNVVSFLMLPIYTRYLSPADYGTIELMSMLLDIVGLIVGLRVEDAIFKFYHQVKTPGEQRLVISNALVAAVVSNLIGTIFILIFSGPLTILMFGDDTHRNLTAIFGLTLMLQSLAIIPMAYIRVQQRPWLYIGLSLLRVVLQLSLNIYLVVVKDMKVEGVVYSAVISTFVIGAVSLVYLYRHVGFATDRVLMRGMLNFSFPLVLASIASFYSAYGDRYFLRIYDDLTDVGIYSLAYKFGFLLVALVWDPFTKSWDVRRYELLANPDTDETYNDNFMVMIGALIFGGLGIAIFLDEILMIMSSPEYWPAASVAPIILLAYVVQQAGSFNCFPIFARGDTKDIAKGHWICAVVITIGYLTLIPRYGMYGAAWSTLGGFLAYFTWIIYKGRPLLDMKLSWNKAALLLAFAILLYLISLLIGGPIYLRIAGKVVLACLYAAVFWLSAGGLQRHMMLSFFRK